MALRTELIARLGSQPFDLLIIGGGIVGAGLARDAAMRGLRVALVEQGDFASGTSSKTSKLIHGGLRYLEQGQLRLVYESLHEREVLRAIAPQLVWPTSLMLPVYRGDPRPRWKIAAGLTLYDWLAAHHAFKRHRMFSAQAALRLEPRLNRAGLAGAGCYTDCQMDDARLCLATILQAVQFGAVCGNYVRVLALEKTGDRLSGAVVEDRRSQRQFPVRASVIVNATGPWSDAIRRLSDTHADTRLAPTKGTHLVVPRLTHHAFFLQLQRDRRMVFVLPWGQDYTLIGTTESAAFDSLDDLHAESDEVEYLLAEVNRAFPEAGLGAADVVATFAGARPLLAFAGASTSASREHQIEIDRHGLVSIMGGKYTTYRIMAKQTLDLILKRWSMTAEPCLTDQVTLLEPTHAVILDRWQDVVRRIPPEFLARLLAQYGTGAFRILQLLEFEPGLAQPLCQHHEVTQAEFVYSLQEELACTLSDILMRRTTIAFSSCQGLDMVSTLEDLLRRYGHFSQETIDDQLGEYRAWLAKSLSFRPEPVRVW